MRNGRVSDEYRENVYVEILEGEGDVVKHERPAPAGELDGVDHQELRVGTPAHDVDSEGADELHLEPRGEGVPLVRVRYLLAVFVH